MSRVTRQPRNWKTWATWLLLFQTILIATPARAQETFPSVLDNTPIPALQSACSPVCEVCVQRYKETCSMYQWEYKSAQDRAKKAELDAALEKGKRLRTEKSLTQERSAGLRIRKTNQDLRNKLEAAVNPVKAFFAGVASAGALYVLLKLLI